MYGKEYEGILRIAYLVDEQSNIEKAYEKVSPKTHACEVLKDLGY
jgi:peroxiredoxin Q/BCP